MGCDPLRGAEDEAQLQPGPQVCGRPPPGGDAEQALPDEPLRTIQETRQELSADSEGRGRWAA